MGEFELEMVQKGLNRILETGEFGDSFMPAAPGGNELDLAIAEILGREEVRSSAETISLALASREV
ncbi:MAG TPA: hypothetical protein VG964_01410 [Candidatus Saccharimonadales bacterium]|nr:hypothetical protein [Candidatus Saccharimonadales bacterium]